MRYLIAKFIVMIGFIGVIAATQHMGFPKARRWSCYIVHSDRIIINE